MNQKKNIHLNHIHLALDSKFKISPNINNYKCIPLNRFDIFSCVQSSVILQNRTLQNARRDTPQFRGIYDVLSFQVLCGIPMVAPYHILLSIGPTCRHGEENYSWQWQCVVRNASHPQQYQAPLIHTHTTFKCYIAFSNIITSCDMPPCILFTIHLFF